MPQVAVVAVYNFVNAALISANVGAIAASNIAHVAAAVASATAKVALMTAANAIIANNNKPEQQGGLVNMAINANEPRRLQIGTRQTGGLLVDWIVGGQKNSHLHTVIYLGEGPCGALKKIFSGGRLVYDANASGAFVHGVRKPLPNFRSGGDRCWITYHDGRPGQTADSHLVATYPGQWTSNHKGTGCAYVVVEVHWDSDNLTSPPAFSFEYEGAKFYDRRKDTTAGGSGAHRIDDPNTWELSTNPAVVLDHYQLGRYWDDIKIFGIALDAEDVPYADFAALANLCDESVDLKAGGTQKRYEVNGFLFADRSFKDSIKDLCRGMNARPVDKGGRIGILDGMPKTPVMTLTDLDLVEGTTDQYRPKASWGDLVTGAVGTFIDPRQNFQPVNYPRIENATWDAEDNGQPKLETLDFEMETSQERAERLALLFVQMKRRQARLTGSYVMKALQLEQGDWFIRTGGKFGTEGKVFEVIDRTMNVENLSITLAAFEVDPADSAWDETDASDPVDITVPDTTELPTLGFPDVTVAAISFAGGGVTFPAFRFVNNDWDDVVPYWVQIEYAFSDEEVSPGPTGEVFSHILIPGQEQSTVYGLIPDRFYVIRTRAAFGTTVGEWTGWAELETTATYSGGEADAVSWDNVYGTGRPADYADVTGLNVAAAITGQGDFALISSISDILADANNLLRRATGGLFTGALAADITALNTAAAITGQGGLALLNFAQLGTTVRLSDGTTIATNALLLTSLGTASAIAGQGALALANFTQLGTTVRLADGSTVATNALLLTSLGVASAITGQGAFATLSSISTALANSNNLLRRSAGGLFTGALAADVTAANTAAAIAGQGGLALANFALLGATLRLADAVTIATNALLLTSLGTAAAFTGQGALATLSAVGTVNVSANAISNVAAAYTIGTGGASAVGDGWTNYQSITITTTGGPVLITASGFATVGSDASAIQSVRIRRGTTLIYGGGGFNQSYFGADSNAPFSATLVDQPAAGTYTYYLQGTISGSEISINQWADRAMTATELKR